jgi:hypothetical protein
MVYQRGRHSDRDQRLDEQMSANHRTHAYPKDARARERLRLAQQREAQAVAAFFAAAKRVAAEESKRVDALSKYQASVDAANDKLDEARAQLVQVSGVERAAILVAESTATLRSAAKSRRPTGVAHRAEPVAD